MSGLTPILWAQEFANPALTAFFTAVTNLGSLEFYMFAIPVVYWLIDKHFGFRFAVFFIFSAYVNSGVKHLFATERPARELRLVEQEGYAFPSGHAQGSTAFWGFLALRLNKPLAWAGAVLMVLLVSMSRIYLGVHWPADILGGVLIGVLLLLAYFYLSKVKLEDVPLGSWMLVSFLAALVLYLLHPTGDGPMTVGFLLGALCGYPLELRYVGFHEEASPLQNILKMALGLIVLFLLRIALKPLVSWLPTGIDYVVRYGFIGLWASLGAPFTFTKLGLFKRPFTAETVH